MPVIGGVYLGEYTLQLISDLRFGSMPIPHFAIEQPSRPVQLSGREVVLGSGNHANVGRKPSIHVMNAQLASDALLHDVANLPGERHDWFK